MPPIPPITKWLLIVNVAAFFLDDLLRLAAGMSFAGWFALWPLGHGFMPWQVVTYAFLHGDLLHLLFNMFALWTFGSELERLWGEQRYIRFYAASVLAAALSQLVVTTLSGSPLPTVGASGGIYGLLLGFGMMFPNRQIMLLIPPIPMKAKVYVLIFGLLELYLGATRTMDGVAHFAHLGGMLGAFLMIRYWRGLPPFRGGRRR
ncbi:rhomboid family intramembrane serine protease [Piscinibacter sp. XHJ-5]|uniref:rhomboid family intramembrane serine protease n=1 Tax=Piscinibacter sp. XHJ-5 TaxID=3037797 RepID=UPI002452BD3B|nr:rhomboid family intramembrane serine protease [Piscinibacter sp. XHJ-5]